MSLLQGIIDNSKEYSNKLLLIRHKYYANGFRLVKNLFIGSSINSKLLCLKLSPKLFNNGNENVIDLRFDKNQFESEDLLNFKGLLIIDDLDDFLNYNENPYQSFKLLLRFINDNDDNRIICFSNASTNSKLIKSLNLVTTSSSVSILTLHPIINYLNLLNDYKLTPSHPSFLPILNELLEINLPPCDQINDGKFLIECFIRKPNKVNNKFINRSFEFLKFINDDYRYEIQSVDDGKQVIDEKQQSNNKDNESSTGDENTDHSKKLNSLPFNLTLTHDQRLARENVELPYLSAQTNEDQQQSVAPVIEYDPDSADDWDDEDPDDDLDL